MELLLHGVAFGYVPGVDHLTPHGRILEQVVYDMLEVAPGAILVRHPELQGRVKAWSFQDLGERVQRSIPVVRMDGAERIGPYLIFGIVAQQLLYPRSFVAAGSVGI